MTELNTQPPLVAGVYAALITPRKAASMEVDTAVLMEYMDRLTATGLNGLVLFGTSGEFVHYDVAERCRVALLAARHSSLPLVVNASHSSLSGAIVLAENAVEAGASGVLLMPPYFYHYSESQIFAFYQQFVRAMGGRIPVYLYNMPYFTNGLTASLLRRLFSTGAFAGIKDSGGEWRLLRVLARLHASMAFQNLAGNDRVHLQARRTGANGIISGVAGALPELVLALDRAWVAKDKRRVRVLDLHMQKLLKYLSRFPAPVGTRHVAVARGWKMEIDSLPFDDATSAELSRFRSWFVEWLPAVLADAGALA